MELWTLGELAERVEAALADYPGQANGRVRAVPDQRAIRWYTTTGLVDRPTEMRGRTAMYSHRHLLQLVAIKRRQAQGHTLAQIQQELSGAPNETLHPIAALPEPPTTAQSPTRTTAADATPPAESRAGHPGTAPHPSNVRPRFWTDRTPIAPATQGDGVSVGAVGAVRVAEGVVLVLEQAVGSIPDPTRLATAAAPLIAELTRQGLLPNPSGDES